MTETPYTIDDFAKGYLMAGRIVEAADRLLVLQVDLGEPTLRQIVFGGVRYYRPEDLIGQQVVVVSNLPTAKLRGVESSGMCLAAKFTIPSEDDASVSRDVLRLVTVDAPPGTRIS